MHTNELSLQVGRTPDQCEDALPDLPASRTEKLLHEAWNTNDGRTDHRAAMEAIRADRETELKVIEVLLLSTLDGFRNVSESLDGLPVKESVLELVGKLLSMVYQFATEDLGMSPFMVDAIIHSHAYGLGACDYLVFDPIEHSSSVLAMEPQ